MTCILWLEGLIVLRPFVHWPNTWYSQHTDFRNIQIETETSPCPSISQLKLSPQYSGFISVFQNMPIRLIDINLNSLQAFKPIMFLTQAFFYIHSSREKKECLYFFPSFFPILGKIQRNP